MKRTNNHPPKAASRLLAWFAGKADLEDIQGDMDEMYGQIKAANGSRAAKLSSPTHSLDVKVTKLYRIIMDPIA
jgi:hypothetical protein